MAAPPTVNTLDLSGIWVMNKSRSDNTEQILALQGVGWFTRKAIGAGTLTIKMTHYKDDDGTEHIDAAQSIIGISGTNENRTLNDVPRESEDHVFGEIIGRSKRAQVEELETDFLKAEWTEDTIEHGVVLSIAESDTPKSGHVWRADQVWGFSIINDERRYVRRIKFTGPKDEKIDARLVYDYLGPVPN